MTGPESWVAPLLRGGPFERAVRAGLQADRLGPPFLVGYRAALEVLAPRLGPPHTPALCATEDGPLHPARILTRLEPDGSGWRLTGHKRWVTGAPATDTLLVLATAGERAGRAVLRAVVVPADADGVTMVSRGAAPFVPEVSHGEVTFEGVRVDGAEVIDGDGWADVVRPFRTLEDVHVLGAVHGYLLGAAPRAGWGADTVCGLLQGLAALTVLAGADPSAPGTHLALRGVFAALTERLRGLELPGEEGRRWERDRMLLAVADRARGARLSRAWAS